MATVSFHGRVFATPSALTALVEGVEVFSGQVGIGQSLDTEIELFSANLPLGNSAVSIAVTSGVVSVGQVLCSDPAIVGSADMRNNDELINGQAPEWPATPVDPMPGGTEEDPNWFGWFFDISAGESITFTVGVRSSGNVAP
jgi:hypothetical protein